MLEELEESFDCAGYCKKGKYYLTKNIAEGPPEIDCVRGAIKGLSGSIGAAAYVTIFLAIILIIAMIGAFPLCSDFQKPKDEP